jgi:hypothetical protein
MLIVPVRGWPVKFSLTSYVTAVEPAPLPGEVMIIQLSLLAAVHPHPPTALKDTLALPPVCAKKLMAGDSE